MGRTLILNIPIEQGHHEQTALKNGILFIPEQRRQTNGSSLPFSLLLGGRRWSRTSGGFIGGPPGARGQKTKEYAQNQIFDEPF